MKGATVFREVMKWIVILTMGTCFIGFIVIFWPANLVLIASRVSSRYQREPGDIGTIILWMVITNSIWWLFAYNILVKLF